jgi:hypothetical protein
VVCGLGQWVLGISADHANESCFAVRKSKKAHDFQLSFITAPTTAGIFLCGIDFEQNLSRYIHKRTFELTIRSGEFCM